jgi:DNA mismatch endonuclease (patch repair protein)
MERKLRKLLPGGRFENVSTVRSRTMGAIRGKHTKSTEVAFRMILMRAGLKGWKLHAADLPGKPDVYFPKDRVAIFVDGCFWHGCPTCGHIPKTRSTFWRAKLLRNHLRDRKNTRALRRQGVNVIRIWEHSLSDCSSIARVIDRIKMALAVPSFR